MSIKLTIGLAKKLNRMLKGEFLPQSTLKGPMVDDLLQLGILLKQRKGSGIRCTVISNYLEEYLANELGIQDLTEYIEVLESPSSKSQNAFVSTDSKIASVQVAKGFAVKVVGELPVHWKGAQKVLSHWAGTAIWLETPEDLRLMAGTTIVGIENVESFNRIQEQATRFPLNSIYISRYYADGKALQSWLAQQQDIAYIHFGDFDLAGLQIYLSEFKPYITGKTSYYSPSELQDLLWRYGNPDRYFKQASHYHHNGFSQIPEIAVIYQALIETQRALEQEVLWAT